MTRIRLSPACLAWTFLLLGMAGESLAASKTAAVKKGDMPAPKSTPAQRTEEDPNIAVLPKLLKQPEGFIDLATAKVTIDHMVDPKVDVQGTLRLLDRWASKVRARFSSGASNKAKLDLLISTLYEPGPWNDYLPSVMTLAIRT